MKPFFGIVGDSLDFFDLLLLERKPLEVGVLCSIKLRKCANPIVCQDITQIVDMISHTNLLNLVNLVSKSEVDDVRPDRKALIIFDFHSLFRNVHPGSVFAVEIYDIEVFKPVKF